jgi:hypothetical protein
LKKKYGTGGRYDKFSWIRGDKIDTLTVEYIGTADKNVERGIVLASFNAG